MIQWPDLFLIAGTGRKVGKTTLACQVITNLINQGHKQVAAIKLTPHFHQVCPQCICLVNHPDLVIHQEMNSQSGKDSARMVGAGAQPVFFVQANEAALTRAVEFLLNIIPASVPVVCESAGLRRIVEPGRFILIKGEHEQPKNLDFLTLANVVADPFRFEKIQPEYCNGQWQ